MAIFFKTQKDIEGLRVANKIVAQTLDYVGDFLSNGMSLLYVNMVPNQPLKVFTAFQMHLVYL